MTENGAYRVDQMDRCFTSMACLQSNGSTRTFLAKTNNNYERLVMLKIANDGDDGEGIEQELQILKELREHNTAGTFGIMTVDQTILAPDSSILKGLVLPFLGHYSLADEIRFKDKSPDKACCGNLYTERRIGMYAAQLLAAVSFCHSRDVFIGNIQASNVLIDERNGQRRLVLSEFGNASPMDSHHYATPTSVVALYASPELLSAMQERSFEYLDGTKMDAFAVGCILFELVCCQPIQQMTDFVTLAQYIGLCKGDEEAFLRLPCVRLPWLSSDASEEDLANNAVEDEGCNPTDDNQIGYSVFLREVLFALLRDADFKRKRPDFVLSLLRMSPNSPLVKATVAAARPAETGAPVTIDNLQLGMFVQRGPGWTRDCEVDGGTGSIGVVVKLGVEASVVWVAWPVPGQPPVCHRFGSNKSEIQVGPTEIPNFYGDCHGFRTTGMVQNVHTDGYTVGLRLNTTCMVVFVQPEENRIFVTTIERYHGEFKEEMPIADPSGKVVPRLKEVLFPEHWTDDALMVDVTDVFEGRCVADQFHASNGGLSKEGFEIVSIQRVQSRTLWNTYNRVKDEISLENWAMANECRVFHGTGMLDPTEVAKTPGTFDDIVSNPDLKAAAKRPAMLGVFNRAVYTTGEKPGRAHPYAYKSADGHFQLLVCDAIFGRSKGRFNPSFNQKNERMKYHSKECGPGLWALASASQMCPAYVVTYKTRAEGNTTPASGESQARGNPTNSESNTGTDVDTTPEANSGQTQTIVKNSPSKLCVVCLENPVSYILTPCGHACLCRDCCSRRSLASMRHRCPECRGNIGSAFRFYGRIVEDEEI